MRYFYLAYLVKLCPQPQNCPRQANSDQTMARLKYCRAFSKLAWGKLYALNAEYLIETRSCYQYIMCGPSKIGCCLGGPQDI